MQLDGELAFRDEAGAEEYTESWRVGLSRRGLPSFPKACVATSVSNIEGREANGYRGSLSACFPFCESRLSVKPALNFRFLEADSTSKDFRVIR